MHSYKNIIENYGNINNIFEILNSDFYFSIFTLVYWQTWDVQTIFDGEANNYSSVQNMIQPAINQL